MHPNSFFQHKHMLTPIIPWKMSNAIFWAISKLQLFSSWSGDCVTTSGDISHFALSLSIMLITYLILFFSCPIFCLSINIPISPFCPHTSLLFFLIIAYVSEIFISRISAFRFIVLQWLEFQFIGQCDTKCCCEAIRHTCEHSHR